MPTENWSKLVVAGPQSAVEVFRRCAKGSGLAPFVAEAGASARVIELVDRGTPLQLAAGLTRLERGLRSRIALPPPSRYVSWKKNVKERVRRDRLVYERERRKAMKTPNPLDLHRLAPLPRAVLTQQSDAQLRWQTKHWGTKWNTWDVKVGSLTRLGAGMASLTTRS